MSLQSVSVLTETYSRIRINMVLVPYVGIFELTAEKSLNLKFGLRNVADVDGMMSADS